MGLKYTKAEGADAEEAVEALGELMATIRD